MLRSGHSPGKLALVATLALAGCSATDEPTPSILHALPVGAERGLTPELAITHRDTLLLSWVSRDGDGRHSLQVAEYADGRWSRPEAVASGEGWFVNWADFGGVATAGAREAVHWRTKSGPSTYAYDIRFRSREPGGAWSADTILHGDGIPAEHGFLSSWDDHGALGLAWLDGRETASGGPMTLRTATIGPDGTIGSETLLDERVCDCCQTGATATPAGPLVVYRDRSPGEVRDMAFVRRTEAGWSEPAPVANDGWEIAACPVNGPAVASGPSHAVVAWFTAAGDGARVSAAWLGHGDERFEAPIVIDDQWPVGRVDVAMISPRRAAVTYLASADEDAELRLAVVAPNGIISTRPLGRTSPARQSGFPRMVVDDEALWITWQEILTDDESTLRLARIELAELKETES